jgi:DNA-binding NarL/FixJ family response regulator
VRVAIADDSALLREGLARLLNEAGIEVASTVADGSALEEWLESEEVDVAIIDIRMPPTFTHEGAQVAMNLRSRKPDLGILLLSQAIETHYAIELARKHPRGLGYLLKDRVVDVDTLVDAVQRVANGGTVLDPDIVAHFLGRRSTRDQLRELSDREREVLALMAEGRSNSGIARQLVLTERTVETHIASILSKLSIGPEPDDHRRVLAVRAWLES